MSSDIADREDLSCLASTLCGAAERCARLIEEAPDAMARVPGSAWTVRDFAAHLALGTEAYAGYVTGHTEPFVDMSDIAGGSLARTSAQRLTEEREQDLGALARRLRNAVDTLATLAKDRRGDERVLWNGVDLDLRSLLGIMLAEYLMHGYDLAHGFGRPWHVDPDDARTVLASALPLLPLLADPNATAGVLASFDLRVRGGPQVTLRIEDGSVTTDVAGARVDCHVSAEPVALLFVAYGRRSQWGPVLTGRMLAWGRRPWLGLRLTRYLVAP
jgi:uncharacterized protein (TIGR03083 family)